MKRNLKQQIINNIARKFLTPKIFIGRYIDNRLDLERFVANRNILVQRVFHAGLHMGVVGEVTGIKPEFVDIIEKEQKKLIKKYLRKGTKTILFYVDDNLITRALGWKETKVHYQLKRIGDSRSDFMKMLVR